MIQIEIEILRDDGVWRPIGGSVFAFVSVDEYGSVAVKLPVGHLQPPWRIMRDGRVIFERQR